MTGLQQNSNVVDLDNIEPYVPSLYAPKNTNFSLLQQLKLKYPNISLRHVGKLVGLSAEAVRQQFLRHGIDFETGKPVAIELFKEHRADIFASKQISVLNTLTDDKLKRASVGELNALFGTLYDKERLERDLSTANVAAVHTDILALKTMKSPQHIVIEGKTDVK